MEKIKDFLKNFKRINNTKILLIGLLLFLFLITILIFYICDNKLENSSSSEYTINDYREADIITVNKVRDYIKLYDKYIVVLSVYVNHSNNKSTIYCSIATDEISDYVYQSSLSNINNLNDSENFYGNSELMEWKILIDSIKVLAEKIYTKADLNNVQAVYINLIDKSDYSTILLTVDSNKNIVYDFLHEQYKIMQISNG